MRSIRPLVAPFAGEFMPSQSQLDEALPVYAFGGSGPLHCGLGFVLWVVLGAHQADTLPADLDKRMAISPV